MATARLTAESLPDRDGRSAALVERRLFARYNEHGDVGARDELIRRRLPLARHLAYRYSRNQEPTEELFQVACLGLVKAVDRYDPERGTTFATFAVPTILGELKRHLRDHSWGMRVPRGVKELALEARAATDKLHGRLGRSPTLDELARELATDTEQVLEALEANQNMSLRSLDEPVQDEDETSVSIGDSVGSIDERYELTEDVLHARQGLDALSDQERAIIRMRFYEDRSQADIAAELGVSQMQISRLLRRALARAQAVANGEPA